MKFESIYLKMQSILKVILASVTLVYAHGMILGQVVQSLNKLILG